MGRHSASAWTEHDHPRDPDGKFAGSGAGRAGGTSRRGMPDAIAGADIPIRGGDEIALDSHLDGSITIATPKGSVRLPEESVSDLRYYLGDLSLEGRDAGEEAWIKRTELDADSRPRSTLAALVRKDGEGKYSLRLAQGDAPSAAELRDAPALQLNGKDLSSIDNALTRMKASSRVDTGNGDLDVFLTDDKKFSFRHLGDDGHPVETKFDAKSFARLNHAIDVVIDGFDENDPTGPDEGVTQVDVKTNVGKVRVELTGTWQGTSLGDRLKITPVQGDAWGIYVDGTQQQSFADAVSKISDAGEALEFYDPYAY